MNLPTSSDETRSSLLQRLRGRDNQDAWHEFTTVYEPVIYKIVCRRGFQDADAREIVQEVLLKVARSIEHFERRGCGSFRGWLSKITRHEIINRLRQLASKEEVIDSSGVRRRMDAQIYEKSLEDKIEEEFDRDHRQQLFRVAAAKVRSRCQETHWLAFWLTAVEGDSVGEVAKKLGMEPGTVSVAKCRILKRIRQLISQSVNE